MNTPDASGCVGAGLVIQLVNKGEPVLSNARPHLKILNCL